MNDCTSLTSIDLSELTNLEYVDSSFIKNQEKFFKNMKINK